MSVALVSQMLVQDKNNAGVLSDSGITLIFAISD
jgi:hypothetical protein